VKTSDDHHRVGNEPIEQLVWKTVQQETTGITMDDPIRERRSLNQVFALSKFRQELATHPGPLAFVPVVRLLHFISRF
jgi:hypothetical protein